ncbi:MAG: sigma 54-interacting transcriptional regulator [Myxococcota bacterium]
MVDPVTDIVDERWEIQRELGRGGMGRVLLARDLHAPPVPGSGRDEPAPGLVALKLLEDDALRGEFVEGFRLLRRLAHPAFVRADDLGLDARTGRLYMVLEWCRGRPLVPGSVQGEDGVVAAAATLLRAVDHLHRLGWVHGDLAPPNILVSEEDPAHLRILDLGAAGRSGTGGGSTSGVLSYAAPERLEGAPLHRAADLWSVGAVLFGLLHGRHPFPGYPAAGDVAEGPDRTDLVSSDLDPWLDRMLAPAPGDRPPDAAAALAALEEAVDGPLPLVPPEDVAGRVARLPFVDVGDQLDLLHNRLRTAADAGRPQILRVGGAPGTGRTRLLHELGHALVGHGIRVVREQALASDGEGDLLARLQARLAPDEPIPPEQDGPAALARGLLATARHLDRPTVLLVDDLDAARPATRRAVDFVVRATERAPDRAGRLLMVAVTDDEADATLETWDAAAVERLLETLFPGRRVGDRVSRPVSHVARGLPGLLAEALPDLARRGLLEIGPSAVQLAGDVGSLDPAPADAATRDTARLVELPEDARREAALLAHAREPVPVALTGTATARLLADGLAVRVMGRDGPRITLRSRTVAEAALDGIAEADAWATWSERWRAADGDDAHAEAAWYAARSKRPGAVDEARTIALELPPEAAGLLLDVVVEDDWPSDHGDALRLADAAVACGDVDLATGLLRRACGPGAEPQVAARALCRLGTLEARQSRHAVAVEALGEALEQAGSDAEPGLRAEILAALARSAVLTGRCDEAGRWSEEGLALVGEGDPVLRGRLRYAAGLVHFYGGDPGPSERALSGALEDARAARDRVEEGAAVTALGLVAHRRGDLGEAAERYREALAIGERCGDDARVLTALQNLGVVLHERGSFTEALDTYEEALELAEALDQRGRVVQLSGNIAHLWRYLGELERAGEVLERGLELARREDNRYMEGRLLLLMGEVALADEAWERAERLLDEAVAAAVDGRSVTEEAEARIELARLHLERQAYRAARREAELARSVARRAENQGLEVQATALLAGAHGRSVHGDEAKAARLLEEALEHVDEIPSPDGRWPVLLEGCFDARRRGDAEEAIRLGEEVRRTLRQLEDAVPARHRGAFRSLRERRRARLETSLLGAPGSTQAAVARPSDDRWARLLEINKRLSAERKVRPLLEYIMDSAILLSGAERGFLLLGEEAGGDGMEVHMARNLDRENIRNTRLKISHGIARRVIDTGEAAVTVDAMADERYRDQLSVHDLRLRSVLCVPMISRRGVLGAIYVDNRFQSSAFGRDDIRVMEGLADQAAIALDTARLVEGMERSREDLEDARRQVEALNARLREQLEARTRELEDTHRVVIRQQRQLADRHSYRHIIGESEPIRAVFAVMDRLLDNTIPVLIEGESGTGKELVARAIHYNGPQRDEEFVAVNCGAIPANLLESELFGHVRGAFTGASSDKKGLFEAAHGGTLLLDELGELPLEMQVKLLRVLQSGEVKKVGSTRHQQVDVRIIAATNRRLDEEVAAGRFREDLYYRLAVIPIRLPPLRERRDDIPVLVQHFLEQNQEAGLGQVTGISSKAMSLLTRYHWPGNVRQLEMVLKNASLFAEGEILQPGDFQSFPEVMGAERPSSRDVHLSGRTLKDLERQAIIQALHDNKGNKKRTAERLGIDRRTLYNKLDAYDIVVENELHVR